MWKLALLLALGTSCGKKEPDCGAYASAVIELSNPSPENVQRVGASSLERCKAGRISEKELTCVESAKTQKDLIECTTGPRPPSPPPAPPKPPSGRVEFRGGRNGGNFKVIDETFNADQREWMDQLEKDVGACSSEQTYDPKEYVFVVTFGGGPPVVTPPRGFPLELGSCVIPLLSKRPPPSVKNGPIEVFIDVGR